MNDIQVLLFGPELPVAGQTMSCLVAHDALYISSPQFAQQHTVAWSGLQATVAGFGHDQLLLSWRDEQAAWSLIPAGVDAQKKLIAALPYQHIPGLAHWHRSTRWQSRVWQSILYTLGFIVLSAVLLVWQYDRVTTWAANHVSMKTEKRLGDSVLQSLNPEANFISEGAAVETVKRIGDQLTAGSAYQYRWYVSKDPAVNAFAIPGGIVVVNSGLLKRADSPDELAAVLAHEVQHIERRHALKNMMNSAAIASVVLVVLGDANAVVMLLAHQVSAQYFNREIESEADIQGVQLLQQKNLEARGMVSFFKKMDAGSDAQKDKTQEPASEKNTEVAGWFSSHPDTLLRIQAIETYLAQHPCSSCTTLTWDKDAVLAGLELPEKQ